MSVDRRRLVYLALSILDDACAGAHDAPAEPSSALRLALGYLYSVAGRDRAPFDQFWQTVIEPDNAKTSAYVSGVGRHAGAAANLRRISRLVEMPVEPGFVAARARLRERLWTEAAFRSAVEQGRITASGEIVDLIEDLDPESS